jgi:hypothetical protein
VNYKSLSKLDITLCVQRLPFYYYFINENNTLICLSNEVLRVNWKREKAGSISVHGNRGKAQLIPSNFRDSFCFGSFPVPHMPMVFE